MPARLRACVLVCLRAYCLCMNVHTTLSIRRTLGRTWNCDSWLAAVESNFLKGPGSLTVLIQNSLVISGIFKRHCEKTDNGLKTKIFNLRAAKHRYESFATPAGRCVQWIDAFIATASELLARPDTDNRNAAENFMQFLTTESCPKCSAPRLPQFCDWRLVNNQ